MAGVYNKIQTVNKERILLVDDDPAFLHVAWKILEAKGYLVDVAHNAAEAISKVREGLYNLVILDILLPDINGIRLLSSINTIQPDIISIILTGYSSVENSVQSLNRGAFAYLEKPLNTDHLLEVIQRGLEKQHLLLENRRLVKELEQRNRDLNILLSLAQTISYSLNSKEIIDSALEIIDTSLGIKGSYALIYDDGSTVFRGHRGFQGTL